MKPLCSSPRARRVAPPVGGAVLLLFAVAAHADVAVTVNHNDNDSTQADFHFKTVAAPRRTAAIDAKFSVVEGDRDPNSGSVDVLHNGDLPASDDQPGANFFFDGDGGRVLADFGKVIPVKEVDTYSWHTDTRAPQVYKVYGSDGSGEGFAAAPKRPQDPTAAGWKLLASVDTRKQFGMDGGQYGVSLTDADLIGNYRYLLFETAKTETTDSFGNTFYSEIAVVSRDMAENPVIRAQTDSKTFEENGLTLVFTNDDPKFDPAEREKLAKAFFVVYPEMMKEFNPKASKKVKFAIETKFRGVAATSGNTIHANPRWFQQNPEDIDVITHEGMHVVQAYKQWDPAWLREGIADYARAKFGVNNGPANWTMPDYNPKQNYTDAYRVTARFLVWLEKHAKPGIVVALDQSMREGKYSAETWKQLTGKSVDELWADYGKNPVL